MQVQKHSWVVAKTGLLIRDVEPSRRNPRFLSGVSEHGTRLHFPESFVHHNATATEVERLCDVAEVRNARRREKVEKIKMEKGLQRLKGMGFHVIHS